MTATIVGDADSDSVAAQVERMLSLDVDASALEQTVCDDRVASKLVAESRGLRPVCFASPYEAAAWSVLGQRVRMKQAAAIRTRMCARLGHAIDVDGHTLRSFPDPKTLRATTSIDGLPALKVERRGTGPLLAHGAPAARRDGRGPRSRRS